MKKAPSVALVLVLAAPVSAQNWFKGSLDQALAKAKSENKLVLIDFFSAGWGGCVLLGQQYYANPKFQATFDKNFVLLRADGEDKQGDALFKQFKIQATPTILWLAGDGSEVDWIVGYSPPPDKFHPRVEKIVAGEDTFKALNAAYAANPKDVAAAFKLGQKWADRYDEAKTAELFRTVLALDPQGKSGTVKVEGEDFEATYTEYAEYLMGEQSVYSRKPDPAVMRSFIAKYPESRLLKQAYNAVSSAYNYQGSKEDAAKFFAEFAGKFPDDPAVLDQWLARINRDKDNLDKGLELAGRIRSLTRSNPVRRYNKDVAELYLAKGDKDKAEETYGKDFMEGQATRLAYDLIDYANFWMQKDANKESALAMVDLALKMRPDALYVTQQAASIYVKNGQEAKALEIYGPAFAQKNADKASPLASYASFWANQGKNLDGALAAAMKAVELKPEAYYGWVTLGNVYLKLKNFDEAVKAAQKALDLGDDEVKDYLKKNLERVRNAAKEKK